MCRAPDWSCSEDTCVDVDGQALGLEPEAGFFELKAERYVSDGETRQSPLHRVWYSFQPADERPEDRPVAVFFNGGPGAATLALFAFNTGRHTFDPALTGDEPIAPNPHSWTKFANLLYIDQPSTGFSYSLTLPDGSQPSLGTDMPRDAAAFNRVLLRFLARHPALRANPVILVGESYGGVRATFMLDQALRFDQLVSDESSYQDPTLHEEFIEHFDATLDCPDGHELTPADAALQFGYQALVQPMLFGAIQTVAEIPGVTCATGEADWAQCDELEGWFDPAWRETFDRVTTPDVLETALGVEIRSLQWLHASERVGAYGKEDAEFGDVPLSEFNQAFGTLEEGDLYYSSYNTMVSQPYSATTRTWIDPIVADTFVRNLEHVRTFITHAPFDRIASSHGLLRGFDSRADVEAHHVEDAELDAERPGVIELTLFPPLVLATEHRVIRFPFYEAAGHMVTVRAPGELSADVRDWFTVVAAAR